MQSLTGSVGVGGSNAVHDVALVRFLMTVIKKPRGDGFYLHASDYSDARDGSASEAIRGFQKDNGLIDTGGGTPRPGMPKPELPGLLEPGGSTWKKLAASVPDDFKAVRTTDGVALVYFQMDENARNRAKAEIAASELVGDFKSHVAELIDKFHAKSGIAVTANPKGLRRTFDKQMENASEASPGETIHHYGYAVDLGFTGLSYVGRAGRKQTVDRDDRGFDKWPRIKEQIFKARNAIAIGQLRMFATVGLGGGDYFHLQHFEDKPLDSVGSFMKLLEKVGPLKMKWRPKFRTWTDYWCDLGLGGEQYYVGASVDIWVDKNPLKLSKEDLAKALSAKLKADPKASLDKYMVRPPRPPTGGAPGKDSAPAITAGDITDQDIARVKALLKEEFKAVDNDKGWQKWEPVKYKGEPRPLNPENPKNKDKLK